MRVFISTGEASGDAYGAALVRALQERTGDLQVEAMGGHGLRATGAHMVADASRNSALGVVRAIGVAPRVIVAMLSVRAALKNGEPGIFIPIDYGFVNIRLARYAKQLGWKVLYFIPPGSYRKDRQGSDLPAITDAIVTPFPWSSEILHKMGANAFWFGHPIKSLSAKAVEVERDGVAVLPGSRMQELQHNLPAIAKAIDGLGPVEFAVASSIGEKTTRAMWAALAPLRTDDRFTENDVTGVLGRAKCAIVCSGTATLQAAIMHCPMVVIYGFSRLIGIEAWVFHRKVRFVALPNIYLDRMAFPELLGQAVTPGAIREWVDRLSVDSEERRAQVVAFQELDETLGPSDCIERTADLILSMGSSVRY